MQRSLEQKWTGRGAGNRAYFALLHIKAALLCLINSSAFFDSATYFDITVIVNEEVLSVHFAAKMLFDTTAQASTVVS